MLGTILGPGDTGLNTEVVPALLSLYSNYPPFHGWDNRALVQGLSDLPKAAWLVSERAGTQTRASDASSSIFW